MAASFAELIRRWDGFMETTGASARTRHHYRYELALFWCDWCVLRELEPVTAPESEIVDYILSLPARGSKRGGAQRALKSFYGWTAGRYRDDDPTAPMRVKRSPAPLEVPDLTDDELRRILRAAFHHSARRGWSIMLCFATGARAGSIVAVERRDINAADRYVIFRTTKNDRPYRQALNRQAWIAALHLLAEVDQAEHTRLLGLGVPEAFRLWVIAAAESAGIERRVTSHDLRYAFSNRVAEAGDPEAWRRSMNHADLSQWPVYNRASEHRVRAVVDRAKLAR
jgi:integrase